MLEEISKSAVQRLRQAVRKDNVNDAIDWSIVIKHLHESQLLWDGDYNEPEEDQEPTEEKEAKDSGDIT